MSNRQSIFKKLVLGVLLLAIMLVTFAGCNADSKSSSEKSGKSTRTKETTKTALSAELERYAAVKEKLKTLAESEITVDSKKIADYDNFVALTDRINEIFSGVESFSVTFDTPSRGENCWRRDINISFKVGGREKIEEILAALEDMENGCLVSDVAVSLSQSSKGEVANANCRITIFEYEESESNAALEGFFYYCLDTYFSEEEAEVIQKGREEQIIEKDEKPLKKLQLFAKNYGYGKLFENFVDFSKNYSENHSHDFIFFLNDEETTLVNRAELMKMLDENLFNVPEMQSVTVKGNTVSVSFYDVTAEEAGRLYTALTEQPMAKSVFLETATTNKDRNNKILPNGKQVLTANITIEVENPQFEDTSKNEEDM